MGRTGEWMSIVAIVVFPIGCAGLELPPAPGPGQGYRFANLKGTRTPDRTLVFVTFSGGGMRSAALTYGATEQLKNTWVELNGRRCRLLVQSNLFGHVRGAFTGAHDEKQGLFALAHGGTIFLDELGDASAELQAKPLRTRLAGQHPRAGKRPAACGGVLRAGGGRPG